jgi:predicted P-loop ATPase
VDQVLRNLNMIDTYDEDEDGQYQVYGSKKKYTPQQLRMFNNATNTLQLANHQDTAAGQNIDKILNAKENDRLVEAAPTTFSFIHTMHAATKSKATPYLSTPASSKPEQRARIRASTIVETMFDRQRKN